ncbi:MAG: peptide MFS transporter [Mangrovibacterium sp.]
MTSNHPKGLIAAALANMGERFGFYTMMAILTLFLMSKFNLTGTEAGTLYSIFYGSIYILALVGGLIADRLQNYKGTIMAGLVIMTIGYTLLGIPALITSKYIALGALLVIAFGNGLFKGNLQALVGQMYDNDKYRSRRDAGFQIFYMFINIGAMVAPFLARWVRNTFVEMNGFRYEADLPDLCHQFLDGKMTAEVVAGRFTELATSVSNGATPADLTVFANNYLQAFNTGFHYAFLVAVGAMLISLVIFIINKKVLPDKKKATVAAGSSVSKEEIKQDAREIQQRLLALFAVFAVVIFFWFSFHQNGLTLTMFAKDYTQLSIFGFNLAVEDFQSINPIFVVLLTPLVILIFSALARRGKEPSTPRKIAIGMGIAAFAFVIMAIGSMGLPKHAEVVAQGGLGFDMRVTPLLLFSVYFILTVAELFISPLGLSFVSKVAPAHMQGLMQGCWLAATAIGNFSLVLGAMMYENISISLTWTVFVIVCALSMIAMLSMVKWLERVAK